MESPLSDDFLGSMEQAQQQEARRSAPVPAPVPAPANDWFQFRRRNADIGIGKTGEDGSLEDWQQLLRTEGSDRLTTAVIKARSTGRKGDRIWFSAVLAALPVDYSHSDGSEDKSDAELSKSAKRAKTDLLIWSVVHDPSSYADARCTWRDGDGYNDRTVSCAGWTRTVRVKERQCVQGQTTWEKMRDRAAEVQAFIFKELGAPISHSTKPGVYKTVSDSPQWRAYLSAQRIIGQA